MELNNQGLSGKSLAPVATVRDQASFGLGRDRSPSPIAAGTVMAPLAVFPVDGLPVVKAAAAPAIAAIAAER